MHLRKKTFIQKCSYIVSFNKKKEWKKDKKIKDEMRKQIRNKSMIHRAINKIVRCWLQMLTS
jgi:hypothetical protein